MLKTAKPIVFIDLETTGLNRQRAKIVEISCLKVWPDGKREMKTRRINPEIPIEAEATAVHGISNEDVEDEPTFRQLARGLNNFIGDSDLAGFNIKGFDIPVLEREFKEAGITFSKEGRRVIDVQTIFHKKEPRDLEAAYKFYCNKDHVNKHSADGDVEATMEILEAQLKYYEDLPEDIESLDAFINPKDPNWVDDDGKLIEINGEVCLNFGRYKGTSIAEIKKIKPDYLDWILGNDFSEEVKEIIRRQSMGK